MQITAQLLTMLLKYPLRDAHINGPMTITLINRMHVLLNSIMCQQISISDCKNEKSLSKDEARSRKKLDMHDLARLMMLKQVMRTPKHVYPFTHIPILITPLQNWMIA